MDRLDKYRHIMCQFLQDFATDDPEAQLIFDKERDRFLVMHVGWRNDYRIYGCAIQLDLIDDKVWIQNNSTEIFVDRELIKRGVDPKDIVLGFRSPSIREKLASALQSY
ncbi:MAG: XisI protein [Xenococcaceae cyanobacterium MO_188.B32]|nr:XisI protein [Xenococcaceae cyanobacterium MO_188.B32]